jgi:hypothetical protein
MFFFVSPQERIKRKFMRVKLKPTHTKTEKQPKRTEAVFRI